MAFLNLHQQRQLVLSSFHPPPEQLQLPAETREGERLEKGRQGRERGMKNEEDRKREEGGGEEGKGRRKETSLMGPWGCGVFSHEGELL